MRKTLILIGVFTITACLSCGKNTDSNITPDNTDSTSVDTTQTDTSSTDSTQIDSSLINIKGLGAGYRYSSYGPSYNPGNEYWGKIGVHIAQLFGDSVTPECIWILGSLQSGGVYLNFPVSTQSPFIYSSDTDENREIFNIFEQLNYKVWLQVEPGMANVDTLIELILNQYSGYKCITGIGIDVEWYKSTNEPEGEKVTDMEAKRWVEAVRGFNPGYKIFLKHWLIEKMPDTERNGIVFIDDSQMFEKMETMVDEFKDWGKAFKPAEVGFQFGYPYDKKWWGKFDDPAKTIGNNILKNVPNTKGLFWVDFTLLEVFPPGEVK